jgi:hypothetical protein
MKKELGSLSFQEFNMIFFPDSKYLFVILYVL